MEKALSSVFVAALICTQWSAIARADECNDFEYDVLALTKRIQSFQKSSKFQEFGWSSKGPYGEVLSKLRSLSEDERAYEFDVRHGFPIMEIFSVADEYRTEGGLDDFYEEIEEKIMSFNCG